LYVAVGFFFDIIIGVLFNILTFHVG
jgi:hypothetical protein